MIKYPNLKSFNAFYRPYKGRVFLFGLFTALAGGVALALPFMSANILINLTDGKYGAMSVFAALLFGIIVVQTVLRYVADYFYCKTTNNLFFDIRKKIAYKAMYMNLTTVYGKGSGFYLERLAEDSKEANIVLFDILKAIINMVINLGFISYITVLNPLLGLIFAAGLAVLIFLEYFRVSRMLRNKKKTKRAKESIKANETEILKGIKEIKGIGAQDAIIEKHSQANSEYKILKYKREFFEKKIDGGISLVKGAVDLMVLLFAGFVLLPKGHVELAAVLVVYNYKGNIYELIAGMAKIKDSFVNGELASKRINDVIAAPAEQTDNFGDTQPDGGIESIEFKNVRFAYNERNVLNGVSFKIDRAGVYGFVGKSGSGKSTIFSLLTGFYKVSDGQILINNLELSTLTEQFVRGGIVPVLQDPYMFNDTVINNVRFARPEASDDEVMNACRLARIHDEILIMRDGYNTVIGENGATVSGGQKQRLEIARAILKDTKVILFDEATSALDKNNLNYMNDLMIELGKTKIIFVIAHRLGIMRRCDKVIVLDEGKIIASDSHDELIKTCGYYAELFKKSSKTENQETTV